MAKFLTKADDTLTDYPSGIKYIIGNEGCERFSYYGMKAILYVFLWKTYLDLGILDDPNEAQNQATAVVHEFNAAVYALPMIGAIIADRYLGKYQVILGLSIVYCLGHAFLAIFETNMTGFYAGLGLIAIGSGGIKPCVSAHVGDQFGKGNQHLISAVFKIFYFIINFGSVFAVAVIPLVLEHWGAAWAFGIPGILMFIATIAFWIGRKDFVHVPAQPGGKLGFLDATSGSLLFLTVGSLFFTGTSSGLVQIAVSASCFILGLVLFFYRQSIKEDDGFLAMTLMALKNFVTGKIVKDPKEGTLQKNWFYGSIAKKYGDERAEGPMSVWAIISVFFLVSVFWALFDQHGSTWIRQAESLNGLVDLGFMSFTILPSQMPATNPFLVMLLIPFTSYFLYPLIDKYIVKLNSVRTMTIGMIMASSSFFAVYLIQEAIEAQGVGQVSMLWQLIPFALLTLSEVMVSITGLEFAYTQAPKSMKSTVMGFWLLTVSLGNILTSLLARFGDLSLSNFFLVFSGLMLGAGLIFGLRAKFYKIKEFNT